eukprot:12240692-Alexandrium_andersonii.AAC.1
MEEETDEGAARGQTSAFLSADTAPFLFETLGHPSRQNSLSAGCLFGGAAPLATPGVMLGAQVRAKTVGAAWCGQTGE